MPDNSGLIAVIGMSFRLPGDISTENQFWQALSEGRNLVSEVSEDRWATKELSHSLRKEPGRSITFSAGVLSRIDEFDAEFFGISPREAAWMDPQQRLFLELAWEAMENAGQIPSKLAGSNCAVYVGISSLDYGVHGSDDLASLGPHFMTGNTFSIAANRLSYAFDLHGPSVAVDTACSSSLVALHHACNSIRAGEASSALVGGVNLLLHPYPFVGFTKASMLSEFGQSRAFDAAGSGYVRAEGGVVLMLKSLDKAIEDGDHIEAVILASGINADGSRKSGMTIPSQAGQEELMNAVLKRSGLEPGDVDYIEAHGTGTSVGDPIEAAAIGAVYGKTRSPSAPIPIGSVKTNLGHMEAASGMAGLVKAILTLKNKALPQSLHFDNPNPNIDFDGLNIKVVDQFQVMAPNHAKPMIVGVNSFGFGGANAHVLLQEPPRKSIAKGSEKVPPLFLSAKSPNALKELAKCYADLIDGQDARFYYDVAYAAATKRDYLSKRLGVLADTPTQVANCLNSFASGAPSPELIQEDALFEPAVIAFIYSGNGSQWHGMGQRLLIESPEFAQCMTQLNDLMSKSAGFSLLDALTSTDANLLEDTTIAQPLIFAIQVCITQWLRDQGLSPAAVAGHSVGEVAAAWASGALSLEQAIGVICIRSKSQGLTRYIGKMAVVGLSFEATEEALRLSGSNAEIAGINSPNNVTISGNHNDLELVSKYVEPLGVFYRLLNLDYPFHSSFMDPIQASLKADLSNLQPSATSHAQLISTVTGLEINGLSLDADYWWQNIRKPVLFEKAINTLASLGYNTFLEIGPHAILQRYIGESLSIDKSPVRVLPSLRQGNDGVQALIEAQLRIHLLSRVPSPLACFAIPGRPVELPNYPWQKERFWHPQTSEAHKLTERRRIHPLLGWRLPNADYVWENILDLTILPWLSDHRIGSSAVLPGSAYLEMALVAAREWLHETHFALEEIDIALPILFEESHAQQIRFTLNADDGSFEISSRTRLSTDDWVRNAVGRILSASLRSSRPLLDIFNEADSKIIPAIKHYELTAAIGLNYGPAFQGIHSMRLMQDRVEIDLDQQVILQSTEYILDPTVLDCCFQSLVDFFADSIEAGNGIAYLPVKIKRLLVNSQAPIACIRGHLRRQNKRSLLADFELYDVEGQLVAAAYGCRFQAAGALKESQQSIARWKMLPRLTPHIDQFRNLNLPISSALLEAITQSLDSSQTHIQRSQWINEHYLLLEALSLSYIYEAFQSIAEKDPQSFNEILKATNSALIQWMIALLKRESLLIPEADGWVLAKNADLPPAEAIWKGLLREAPRLLPILIAISRIGKALPDLLSRKMHLDDMRAMLSPNLDAGFESADLPSNLFVDESVAFALEQIRNQFPSDQVLRILEIASTSSSIPESLLDPSSMEQVQYTLALPSDAAIEEMKSRYRAYDHLHFIKVDATQCLLMDEAIEPNSAEKPFDLVLLRQIIHCATNQKLALQQCQEWLVPGGQLILLETNPGWASDLLGGTGPHWWRPSHDANEIPRSSLNFASAWTDELEQQGFEDISTLSDPACEAHNHGDYVIFARKPLNIKVDPTQELADDDQETLQLVVDSASRSLAQELGSTLSGKIKQVEILSVDEFMNHLPAQRVVLMLGWQANPVEANSVLDSILAITILLGNQADSVHLCMVTVGGALISTGNPDGVDPVQSAISGMARVIMNEYPQLQCQLIDLPAADIAESILTQLVLELNNPCTESEVILTEQGRFAPQLHRVPATKNKKSADDSEHYRLDFIAPGQLRNLDWYAAPSKELQADQVEVQTQAVGLNFRDVMYTMGLLRDEAVESGFAGPSLGLEFSGTVTRVGENVKRYKLGDPVMGFAPACFASHVVTPQNAIAPMPPEWSFESAATVPTTFFTAYYALHHLAQLQTGERVLIHGAAGGVGIAAIQIAQYLGAEVFATAGADEKRDFVRLLGVQHVYDSRTLDYAEDILRDTQGEGVDVVLNSLAGEAIRRNLQVLKPFGRFLELGKRDYFENTSIGIRPFKDNISYFGIDADQLLLSKPILAAKLFGEVMELLSNGTLYPLPYQLFAAKDVVSAFRSMQQSRHIGKIVVSMAQTPSVSLSAESLPLPNLALTGTWIITGGVSGFGLESARWLVSKGVKHLVLIGRRGLSTPGIDLVQAEWMQSGVQVQVMACDITDHVALSQVIEEVTSNHPPIEGIIHAAAHFHDSLIANLDPVNLEAVLNPKLLGAWNLHELTQHIPLRFFVLYSSITTAIGNPGQANYVAANAGLEGLARMRQASGLPVTCIGWGPIEDAGYLTRNLEVKTALAERLGSAPMTSLQALGQLESLLLNQESCTYLANFEWANLSKILPSANASRFDQLNQALASGTQHNGDINIHALIEGMSAKEAEVIVTEYIRQELALILLIAPERIDANRSLHDLGMDSLMGVELALGLERSLGMRVPAMMLNGSPTLNGLGQSITRLILGKTEEKQADSGASVSISSAVSTSSSNTLVESVEALIEQHGEVLDAKQLASSYQASCSTSANKESQVEHE